MSFGNQIAIGGHVSQYRNYVKPKGTKIRSLTVRGKREQSTSEMRGCKIRLALARLGYRELSNRNGGSPSLGSGKGRRRDRDSGNE